MVNKELKYKKLTQIEHLLRRPALYIGSVVSKRDNCFLLDKKRIRISERPAEWNPALLKLFDEIISNCVDEATKNKKLDTIKVSIDRKSGRITVEDNGGIPVVIDKHYKQYIPEMIFTELLCGSNFEDDINSTTTGQNGIGSKAVCIFSTVFEVTTCDGKNQFFQKCEDNLSKKSPPKITKSRKSGTTISCW